MLVVLLAAPAGAASGETFPNPIPLPDGWRPEGIASGRGTTFYAGSLADGAIYAGDFRTGKGGILVAGQPGLIAVGMYVDQRTNYLFVAGGAGGQGRIYDASTGAALKSYQFQSPPTATFVNDVIVTRDAVYFTDSFQAFLYRVPLSAGGKLSNEPWTAIPLTGDFVTAPGFNTNGVEATSNGRWLVIVQSATGKLFRVDPQTGDTKAVDLHGELLTAGDGLRFAGQYLYVVRNQLNRIAVVRLDHSLTSGTVERDITDPAFRVPTTIASFGDSLYAVNARFGTPPGPTVDYDIVKVPRN
jgi:sugar lactone lactonase YvrE